MTCNTTNRIGGVYLHIPFCTHICTYCDFHKMLWDTPLAVRYLDDLIAEILLTPISGGPDQPACGSIFFGGGTPSLLTGTDIARIMDALRERVVLAEAEITVECNPGTIDIDRLRHYKEVGVNRISFGVQSFDPAMLRRLGRVHTAEEAGRALADARKAGFQSVNLDLMFGLPLQTLGSWQHDLDCARDLAPEHLSLYSLVLDDNTPIRRDMEAGILPRPDDDRTGQMFEAAIRTLTDAGYHHYEISNFARPGCESRHNRVYWNGESYWGFGVGAHGFDGRKRWWNVRSLDVYHTRVTAGESPVAGSETLSPDQRRAERIMLQLRQSGGLHLAEFMPGLSDTQRVDLANALARLPADLIERDNHNLKLTPKGWMVADTVILQIVEAITE